VPVYLVESEDGEEVILRGDLWGGIEDTLLVVAGFLYGMQQYTGTVHYAIRHTVYIVRIFWRAFMALLVEIDNEDR